MTEIKSAGPLARKSVGVGHGLGFFLKHSRVPAVPGRRRIMRDLQALRRDLETALPGLPPQKRVLVDQVITCQTVVLLILHYLNRTGLFRKDEWDKGLLDVQPVVRKVLGSYMNTQRLALMALGLDKIEAPAETLEAIILEHDKKTEEEARAAENRATLSQDGQSQGQGVASQGQEAEAQSDAQGEGGPEEGEGPGEAGQEPALSDDEMLAALGLPTKEALMALPKEELDRLHEDLRARARALGLAVEEDGEGGAGRG